MKKLTLLVLVVMLLSVALVACGEDHVHTFSADWSKNDTQHWNAATCEHSSEVDNKADHVDINNDKICDVCAYDYNHEHAYSADWTYDAENHWNAASCGCTIAPKNVAAHADEDNDGACDVCGHIASLSHTFASEWSTDAENHWKAALCGHDVVAEKAAHDLDTYGFCTVCGYNAGTVDVSTLTLEEAIALGLARADSVANGSFTEYMIASDSYKGTIVADYTFEDGKFYISTAEKVEQYNTTLKRWLTNNYFKDYWYYDVNGSIWAIVKEDGEISLVGDEVSDKNLDGYRFDSSFFNYNIEPTFGIEAYLDAIYNFAKELDTFVDGTAEAENGYAFSFSTGEGEDLVSYTVAFTLNADSYFVETASMTRSDDSTLELVQSDVVVEDPFAPENFGMTAFDLVYTIVNSETGEPEEVVLGDSYDFVLGTSYNVVFTVKNYLPEFANLDLDVIHLYVDGELVEWLDWGSFRYENGEVIFSFYKAGEYEVTLKSLFAEKTVAFNVTAPAVSEINTTIDYTPTTETTIYIGESLMFNTQVNSYANPDCTVVITSDNADKATLVYDENQMAYVFVASEAGTYVITVTSAENAEITATLTVTVKDLVPVDIETLFNTNYVAEDDWGGKKTVTFTPDMIDVTVGTVLICDINYRGETSCNYNYVYDEDARTFTLTPVEGEIDLGLSLIVNGDATLSITDGWNNYVLVDADSMEVIDSKWFSKKTYTFVDGLGRTWYLRFTYFEPAYEGAPDRYYLIVCDAASDRYQNGISYDYTYEETTMMNKPATVIKVVWDGVATWNREPVTDISKTDLIDVYGIKYDAATDTMQVMDQNTNYYTATRYEG